LPPWRLTGGVAYSHKQTSTEISVSRRDEASPASTQLVNDRLAADLASKARASATKSRLLPPIYRGGGLWRHSYKLGCVKIGGGRWSFDRGLAVAYSFSPLVLFLLFMHLYLLYTRALQSMRSCANGNNAAIPPRQLE